jgi:hypothetical protein
LGVSHCPGDGYLRAIALKIYSRIKVIEAKKVRDYDPKSDWEYRSALFRHRRSTH